MANKTIKKAEVPSAPQVRPTGLPVHGVYGLLLLFVCVSIAYANYMVFFGTSDMISKIMLLPSTLFVAGFLLFKAAK